MLLKIGPHESIIDRFELQFLHIRIAPDGIIHQCVYMMKSECDAPHGSNRPLKVGDRVRVKPEWQDPGDDDYERYVIEAPEDCTRVLVQTIIPGCTHHPVARIETSMLEMADEEMTDVAY
jgi:hypothetical protein